MSVFKTLRYKESNKYLSGRYAVIFNNELGDSTIPVLLSKEATLKIIKKAYPDVNFDEVEVIDVKLLLDLT